MKSHESDLYAGMAEGALGQMAPATVTGYFKTVELALVLFLRVI